MLSVSVSSSCPISYTSPILQQLQHLSSSSAGAVLQEAVRGTHSPINWGSDTLWF